MRQLAPMTRPMSESDGRTSEAIAVQTPGFREAGLRADTDRRGQLLRRRREGSWLLASHSSVWPAQCRPGHRPATTLPRCAGGAGCCVQDSLALDAIGDVMSCLKMLNDARSVLCPRHARLNAMSQMRKAGYHVSDCAQGGTPCLRLCARLDVMYSSAASCL